MVPSRFRLETRSNKLSPAPLLFSASLEENFKLPLGVEGRYDRWLNRKLVAV